MARDRSCERLVMKHVYPGKPEKASPYDGSNLRFRKAYIRECLAANKAERDALIAEREKIVQTIKGSVPRTSVAA